MTEYGNIPALRATLNIENDDILADLLNGAEDKHSDSLADIYDKDGYVNGMQFEIMELGEPDESGRRSPVGTGQFVDLDVDTVIVALGTGPNPIIQKSAKMDGIEFDTDRKGYFTVDSETRETSVPHIYAGGDVAPVGESNAINAMGAGKKAAKAINDYLSK